MLATQNEDDPGYLSVFRFENDTWRFQVDDGEDFLQHMDEQSAYQQFGIIFSSTSEDGSTVSTMGTLLLNGAVGQDIGSSISP
jgi:hypothetical protein